MSFAQKSKTLFLLLPLFLFVILTVSSSVAQEVPEDDPSFKERKVSEGFTLNLKDLIDKSKKKIEQVDGKLKEQAKDRRNQQREEKAREYYDKAKTYYEQGELDAAKELWEKAIKITEHEEMEGYLSKSVRRQRKEEKLLEKEEEKRIKRLETERGYTAKEVNKKYKEGVNLYRDKNYLASKVAFEEVDQMFPDHRATKSYLALIDRKIEDQQKNLIEEKLKNNELTSAKAKARWKKELEEQEEARQRNLDKQADALYKEGVRLYKDKQYSKAKEKFKEVEWILPDYKDTIKYLSKIDKDIAKTGVQFTEEDKLKYFKNQMKQIRKSEANETKTQVKLEEVKGFSETRRRQEEAAFVYEAAVTLYKKKYYAQALEKFYEVNALSPNYEATQKYIKKLEAKIPEKNKPQMAEVKTKAAEVKVTPEQTPAEEAKSLALTNAAIAKAITERQDARLKQAEATYQQALALYNNRDYAAAQKKFIVVESLVPAYKATHDYLNYIDSGNFPEKSQTAKSNPARKIQKDLADGRPAQNTGLPVNASFEEKYKQAKKLYQHKEYAQAKQLFVAVNDERPGFKSTLKYISKINKRIKNGNGHRLAERNMAQNNVQAPSSVNNFNAKDGSTVTNEPGTLSHEEKKYQEAIDAARSRGIAKRESTLDDVVEKTYEEALGLYELERFSAARAKFTTVEELSPGYKEAAKYIKAAEEKLALKENAGAYDRTEPLRHDQKVNEEKQPEKIAGPVDMASLKDPNVIDAEMRDVIRYGNDTEIKALYDLGKRLYKARNYQKSRNIFALIQERYPNYKSSSKYIAKIDELIVRERRQREKFQQLASQIKDETEETVKGTADAQVIKQQTENYFANLDKMTRAERKEFAGNQKLFKNPDNKVKQPPRIKETDESPERVKNPPESAAQHARKLKGLNREAGLLKAQNDATLVASSMNEEFGTDPLPQSGRSDQALDQDEKEERLAKEARLRRLKEEEIKEAEERVVFQRELNAKLKAIDKEQKNIIEQGQNQDMTVKKEEERRIREEQAKRKEIKKQTLDDLAAVKKETIKLLKQNELARAKEMMFQYEDLIAKGDFTEKERLGLRNELSKEKLRIQKEQDKVRLKEERTAYDKVVRTPEDENKLKIQRQRELDEIENRIRDEERKLKTAQKKEDARLKRLAVQKEKELTKNTKSGVEISVEPADVDRPVGRTKGAERNITAGLDQKSKVEIEKLVMDRKKELKMKREEIQKQFDKSLVLLYKKAEKYYKQGLHQESGEIFEEIQRLRPGYKNTQAYLSKIYRSDFERQQSRGPSRETYTQRKVKREPVQYVRPAAPDKQSRLETIKNALDNFEETMW